MTIFDEIKDLRERVQLLESLYLKDKGISSDEAYLKGIAEEIRRDPEAWRAKMKGRA